MVIVINKYIYKMKKIQILLFLLVAGSMAYGREYHVSTKGNDTGTGAEAAPFRTINRAAQAAYPGDVITVHAGTYREWVNPPRGGTSDDNRIVYRAAPGERVEIKGSEVVNTWTAEGGGVWKVTLPGTAKAMRRTPPFGQTSTSTIQTENW
jgi:hypothetical protein